MRLKIDQYEQIKQTVIDTYQEYDIRCVPISAFELAIKMGIKLVAYSSLSKEKKEAAKRISKDGYSVDAKMSGWQIYYNDEDNNYERINRTIMHEIGHYSLGHIKDGKEEEMEANFFAKYALAPPPLVHKLPNVTVKAIKVEFDISWKSAYYAHKYYESWCHSLINGYTDYEFKLLGLFDVA